jgi:hypothetical protein
VHLQDPAEAHAKGRIVLDRCCPCVISESKEDPEEAISVMLYSFDRDVSIQRHFGEAPCGV